MAADGSIIINTKLDTSGINQGKMSKAVQAAAAAEIKKMNADIKTQEKVVKNLSFALEKLLAEYNAMIDVGFSPNDAGITAFDLEKVTPAAAALDEAKAKLEGMRQKSAELTAENERLIASKKRVEKQTKKISQSFESFGKRISMLAKRVFLYSIVLRGLRAVFDYFKKVSKTSSELTTAFARLKGALITAFTPIWEAILPALIVFVNVLTKVVLAIAAFFSWLTGKPTSNAAELYKQAEAISGVGKAADKAKKSLAAFDEINNLSTSADAGGGAAQTVAPKFDFENMDKISDTFEEILKIVGLIALGIAAWKVGKSILDFLGLAKGGKILGGTIMIAMGVTLANDNINSILGGEYKNTDLISGIKSAISGALIGGGLIPMGAASAIGLGLWAIPIGIILTAAVTTAVTNWDEIKLHAEGMWKAIKGAFMNSDPALFWEGVTQAWMAYLKTDSWTNKLAKAIVGEDVWNDLLSFLEDGGSVQTLWETWWDANIKPWFTKEKWAALGEEGFLGVGGALATWGSGDWSTKLSDWWDKKVKPTFTNQKWNELAKTGYLGLGGAFLSWKEGDWKNKITSWWTDSVAPWFTKEKWVALGSGLVNGFNTTWENAVNGARELINKFIRWINDKLNFSWDAITIMGKTIVPAGSFQLFKIPEIPHLAQGTVVPRNREFAAILGDNKTETEVVSPLSTMKQALLEALQESGGGDINLTVLLDGDVVHKSVVKRNSQATKRTGRNPLLGV